MTTIATGAGTARRTILKGGVAVAAASLGLRPLRRVLAQTPIRVGVMLPYSGTYAALGQNIADAMKLAIDEQGGLLGGRPVEWVEIDDESDPAKAPQNADRLIVGEEVDFVVGTVHSGVCMAIVQVARQEGTITLIPNAGVAAATGEACAPNIFRTSFSNWQPSHPIGNVAYGEGARNVVTMAWDYGAGREAMKGFEDAFVPAGGTIVKQLWVPFPDVEFQANLTEIASLAPDGVMVFFAGGGAVKFTKDYEAAGLKGRIALYSSGFLTEGTLEAQGSSAEGLMTTLHYAEDLDNELNAKFRPAFQERTGRIADVYAVQGYDTGQVLALGAAAVEGDTEARDEIIAAIAAVEVNSPRGTWTFSPSHNPVQDFYLRRAEGGINKFVSVAAEDLADPATGCTMG